jgi:hypothetical protein
VRAWPLVLLAAGCGLFGGQGGRRGQNQPTRAVTHDHLELVLVSRCARAVEVCYGSSPKCLTLARDTPQSLHVASGGGDVFVALKDSSASVFADATFSMVEVEESCVHLRRRLKP